MKQRNDFSLSTKLTGIGNNRVGKGTATKQLQFFLQNPELFGESFWSWLTLETNKHTKFSYTVLGGMSVTQKRYSPAFPKNLEIPKPISLKEFEEDFLEVGEYEVCLVETGTGVWSWEGFWGFCVSQNMVLAGPYSFQLSEQIYNRIPTGVPVVCFTPHSGVTLLRATMFEKTMKGKMDRLFPGIDPNGTHFLTFKKVGK